LVVEAKMTGYEQFTVVKNRAALAYVDHAIAALSVDGSAEVGSPVMWDAEIDLRTGEPRNIRKIGLTDGPHRRVTVDKKWLTDPARSFPVTIDPADQMQVTRGDTYVNSSSATTSYWSSSELMLGTQNSGVTKRTAYVNLTAEGMAGATIHYANLKLWSTQADGPCTTGTWQIYGTQYNAYQYTTWNTRSNLINRFGTVIGQDGDGHSFGGNLTPSNGVCTGQWVDSDAAGLFQYAANHNWWEFTAALHPYWNDTNLYFKKFRAYESGTYPHAIVNWSMPPTLSSRSTGPAPTCVTGAGRPMIGTTTPALSATYVQGEGIASHVTFEWSALDGSVLGSRTVDNVASGSPASVTIPSGQLVSGGVYRWRTKAVNVWGAPRDWSDPCEFQVEAWAPPVSGCPGPGTTTPDFNGDGYRDSVIADPLAYAAGLWESGRVHIVDGKTGSMATLDQNLAEVPDSSESGDRFGSAIAVLDLNSDGCSELAIGTPYENLDVNDAGRVDVLYGTPNGLGKGPAAEQLVQGSNRIPGAPGAHDWFGHALAAGRTAAGEPYLISGAPGEDVSGQSDSGSVTYLRAEHRIAVDQAMIAGQAPEADDRGGQAVAASPHHFAVAFPGESIDAANQFGGRVCVFTHTLSGGRPGAIGCVDQSRSDVSDSMEAGDTFGKSISMAPYRHPATPVGTESILAVGVPGEDFTSTPDTGVVHQFRIGTSITELAYLNQDVAGVSDSNEPGDLFGEQVLVANTNPSAEASASTLLLAVGSPGEDNGSTVDSGRVMVVPAATNSISGDASVQRGTGGGLPGSVATRELLGIALAGTSTELLVASPHLMQQGVYALKWSELAAGRETVSSSMTPSSLSVTGARAFGAQVG
jgi:hypothetical protein